MKHILLITALLFSILSQAQKLQGYSGPELIEKGYLHTDRSLYFPGDTIWFKGYLTQGENIPAPISDYAYTQLISPDGSIVSSGTYEIENGTLYGQFPINQNWIGGIYKLKVFTQWMLNEGKENVFTKKITVQKIIPPKLQMKFDFLKESFGPGSDVNAILDLKDLENNPLAFSNTDITITIRGKNYIEKTLTTNQEGILEIDFKLPENLTTKDILVNCVTTHNGDTESIARSVPVVLDSIDLQWFPESGILLKDFDNKVAFKAVNEYGKPADVTGHITNNLGDVVAHFSSFHDGMGAVNITPKINETYKAHITSPIVSQNEYLLPESEKEGIILQLDSTTQNKLYFTIKSSIKTTGILSAVQAQKTIYTAALNLNKGTQKIQIPNDSFKKGITKFTFQTDECEYIAERLVFMHYNKKLTIEINTNKTSYETREKINIDILTKDHEGNPVPANLSLAAVNSKLLTFADDRQNNILSYFLMSSELKGSINKPNFYFEPKEKGKAQKALDYVLLTHGWRKHIFQNEYDFTNAQFPPENSTLKTGQIINERGQGTKATLLVFEPGAKRALPIQSNNNGYFSFITDTSNYLILVAYNEANEKLSIQLNSNDNQNSFPLLGEDDNEAVLEKSKKNLLKPNSKKPLVIKAKETQKITLNSNNALDEVIVTAQGIKREKKALGYAVSEVRNEELEFGGDVSRVLSGKASGVSITSSSGSSGSATNVIIRGANSISGNNEPLFVIDGIPYSPDTSVNEISLSNIDSQQIESVNVIKGLAATTLYGTAGRNGVIVITTRSNSYGRVYGMKRLGTKKNKNYTTATIYNYNSKRVTKSTLFYAPVYESNKVPKERTDFRQTLYWNPVIETNKNGEASISYYNSDETTSVTLIAEGISPLGELGKNSHTYSIRKPVNIDFKVPPYLSQGDVIELEMIVQNNTNKPISGNLDLLLTKEISLIKRTSNSRITIPKNSFSKVVVAISPNAPINQSKIKVRFRTETTEEIITKPITIVSPNFPVATTINGSKSGSYNFNIDNVVPNSISADLTIYTDVIGDIMDGISSMLREPHGCFEQTSSTTYPNVMILQYLRESGTSNPEVEAKALNYIKKGYKRLINFETSEGGFEWFGKTPPHETLTAYGILEFTEMQSVYPNVSQNMIDRTVQWILKRRDGNGGFKKSKKGYDSFTSSPQDVANAYILYALSESGRFQNLTLEYEKVLIDSKNGKDAYKLALMANTAYNVNKINDYEELVQALESIINIYGLDELPVQNTITRSYGNSKQIETLSFTALALMKSTDPDQVILSKLIEKILSYRSYNRFGSTQSTVIALKALIEYTRLKKKEYVENENLIVTINGEELPLQLKNTTNGKLSITNLAEFIKNGENNIQLKYSNPEQIIPYSLNVNWLSTKPASYKTPLVSLQTSLNKEALSLGETVRQTVKVNNLTSDGLGMITAVIGIPAGTSPQPWQLKELTETKKIAYYEVYDNFVVLYWRSFKPEETKTIQLDLKTEIKGKFKAAASNVYPYYGDEMRYWTVGTEITIL